MNRYPIPIYTSYFAKLRELRIALPNAMFVTISRYRPQWLGNIEDVRCEGLAPSFTLLRDWKQRAIDESEYRARYLAEVGDTAAKYIATLCTMAQNRGHDAMVLLCYESPKIFCHRHLLAEHLGGIREWVGTLREH